MVVMLAYLDQEQRQGKAAFRKVEEAETKRATKVKSAPSFTQRSLLLPYTLGINFLLRGKIWNWFRGGIPMSDLDYAYAHPPLSTRHILHPPMYWKYPEKKYTPPTMRDLAGILGEGWTKTVEGSIGELGLSVLTGARVNLESADALDADKWTNRASAGTIGDVFQHYEKGDRKITVLVTAWESTLQAEEFARSMRPMKGKRYYIYGANFVVLAGDVGDKGDALAAAAFEGAGYWPHDETLGKWPPDTAPDTWKE
jgi:hypothetical protein